MYKYYVTTKRRIALTLPLIFLLSSASIFLWQWLERQRLMSENARLLVVAAEPEVARVWQQGAPDDPEWVRKEHAELLRLRGELAQLRRQISERQLAVGKNLDERNAEKNQPPENSATPLEHYAADFRARVPWQHTVVTGGWKLPSGKRAVFFIEPRRLNAAGDEDYDLAVPAQISLKARIAEAPEEVLARLGLDSLKSDTKDSARQILLTGTEAKLVLRALEQTSGVDLLSAPAVTTLDGRPSQISLSQTPLGAEPQAGPLIDFTPYALPDGRALDLRLSANLWVPVQ